ncbi:MAG TPA: universal stress protein [Thermomicrobiales bacterium]|nr:universal stress protein [Thermomicrobiales bacterium]
MAASSPIEPAPMHHLLVPLDGSALAEAALPAAIRLGRALPARVTLLHVMERGAPATVHGHAHLDDAAEAAAYLTGVEARFAEASVTAEVHVHPNPEGDVAASIAEHAAEFGADLIVLCAHGEGGVSGWWSGAMAQQVIRRVAPPVLLVRPRPDGSAPPFAPAAALVALDGGGEGEAALPPALTLAQALNAQLVLAVVVPTVGALPGDRAATAIFVPSATAAALDLEEDAAAAYLDGLADRLRAGGAAVRTVVARGDVVRRMATLAEEIGPNILALATHGRAGLDAFWSGSVGSRVVAKASGPLLLVHPPRRRG